MQSTLCPSPAPAPDAVRQELERILSDSRFAASERNTRFLRFVVERTLAGEANQIKEMVIAIELYNRSSDYDPKVDSIVRVEATRIRAKLQNYYDQQGAQNPVRITLPRGTYVPQFEAMMQPEPIAAPPPLPMPAIPVRRLSPLWALPVVLTCVLLTWRASASSRQVPAEAVAAWQEGNELLRQDPHSGYPDRGVPPTLERAIERFEVAVASDPRFAPAWASLAEAYEYASAFAGRDRKEDARRAESAARRAVALDPDLPAGHAMLGLVLFCLRWDLKGAEAEYRAALALDPRNPNAAAEFADLLRETGRLEEAEQLIRRSRALLPALPVLAWKEAEIQLDLGRHDAAIVSAETALRFNQSYGRAHVVLGMAWESKGDPARALAAYQRALALQSTDRRALPAYGYLLGKLGRREEAAATARTLVNFHQNVRNSAFQIATVYMGLGDSAQALRWLEEGLRTRQMLMPALGIETRFQPLHGDPRFQALLAAIARA